MDQTNLDVYGHAPLPWSRAAEQLAAPPGNATHFLATVRPDGRPHVADVGALWVDDKFYFVSGAGTRKSRNLAERADCVISIKLADLDLVAEGGATKVIRMKARRPVSVIFLALVLAACAADPGGSPASTPLVGASASAIPALSASSSATAVASQDEQPVAAEPRLAIFSSTVNGLRLRTGPSLAADVVEFVTGNPWVKRIDAGQLVAALDGPVAGDGYDWYLVQVIGGGPGSERLGWAATPQDGDAWLVPSELDCSAAPPDLAATMAMGPAAALYCSDGEDLTLEGYAVTGFGCNVMGNFEPMWLAHPCANMSFISPAPLGTIDRPTFLHFPAPGVTNSTLTFSDDQVVRIVGHYDDPAAAGCVIEPDDDLDPGAPGFAASDPAADVAECRLRFVVTEVIVLP